MINFSNYNQVNPQIFEEFKKFAFQAKKLGYRHYSAKGIFEDIRKDSRVHGKDGFKLNNNYHADYARKLMAENPEFKGFFETRQLKSVRK